MKHVVEGYRMLALLVGLLLSSHLCAAELSAANPAPANQGEESRLIAGISSAEQVLSDLEYMIVTLAEKDVSWQNNVYPNLDIFLIGVSLDQPIRFDVMMSPEDGYNIQPSIPISDLKEFNQDNLEPIDIVPKRDRQDRELYQLTGTVVAGWMRYLPEPIPYVVMFLEPDFENPKLPKPPKDIPHPQEFLKGLDIEGALAFVSLSGTQQNLDDRRKGFEKYSEQTLSKLEKRTDETREEFELRKKMQEQSLAVLEQYFSETADGFLRMQVDPQAAVMSSTLSMQALPGTELEKNINRALESPSYFAAIKTPEDALTTLRINLPLDEARIKTYQEIYDLARPVFQEEIVKDEDASQGEKQARQKLFDLALDVFQQSADLKTVDLFLDIIPSNDKNALILGVRCTGSDKIEQMIDLVPAANEGWTLKKNVDKIGEVSIHHLNIGGDLLKSLADFYGTSGDVYLAVSDDAFWLSGGEDSLNILKSRLEAVASVSEGKADGVIASLEMNARPILNHLKEFLKEANLDIIESFNLMGRLEQRFDENASERQGDPDRPGRRATGNLANFEWEETAIEAMTGLDDSVKLVIKATEQGHVSGESSAQKGVLKALGAVIAKFSDENLQ